MAMERGGTLIEAGAVCAAVSSSGSVETLRIHSVHQRNWSRIGEATNAEGDRRFIKQFVDARGRWLSELFDAELSATTLLARVRPTSFEVVEPIATVREGLIAVYPFVELERLDLLLDRDDRQVGDVAASLAAMVEELERLTPAALEAGVRDKRREPSDPGMLGWKGLDVMNLSFRSDGRLDVYDFGPLAVEDPQVVVARLVGSALMTRWGRPIRRTWSGPAPWVPELVAPVRSRTSAERVDQYVDRVFRTRRDEPQSARFLARTLVARTTSILERGYRRKVDSILDRT